MSTEERLKWANETNRILHEWLERAAWDVAKLRSQLLDAKAECERLWEAGMGVVRIDLNVCEPLAPVTGFEVEDMRREADEPSYPCGKGESEDE